MSRSSLFWILLALWFILGWWLCKKFICGASAAAPVAAAAAAAPVDDKCDVSLLVEDGTFRSSSDRNLRFPKSDYNNIAYGQATQTALQSTADYLKNNANRSLLLTGNYAADESYDGILPNLGMARATTIKGILTEMGAPAAQIDIRGSQNTDICYSANSSGGLTGGGNSYDEIVGTGIPLATVLAGGNGLTDGANGAGTGAGGSTAGTGGTTSGTGVGNGSTAALGAGSASAGGSIVGNGIGYAFIDTDTGDARLAQIKERLFGKPITLYYETNSDRVSLSAQQRQDFADLSYYLDKVPTARLEVGGHTDTKGSEATNRRLSRNRAKGIQDYIEKNTGIKTARFTAQGYGPKKPIATNDTSEGRAKNRRVEVILK